MTQVTSPQTAAGTHSGGTSNPSIIETTVAVPKTIALRSQSLWDYCKRHGITRAELARRMGVDPMTAYRVDRGAEPSVKFIAAMMDETGMRFEELFELKDKVRR